jgi:hypothetical protein
MSLSAAEARTIAKDAYIYAVPMVAQYKTMYAYSIDKGGRQYMGPFNSILNIARVFTPRRHRLRHAELRYSLLVRRS